MSKAIAKPKSSSTSDHNAGSPRQAVANLISPKLKKIHFDRLAIVYVRQSSPHQVREHRESTALQYALVDRAIELGFHPSQVIVIDEDQARSGTSALARQFEARRDEARPGLALVLVGRTRDRNGLNHRGSGSRTRHRSGRRAHRPRRW